MNTLIDCRVITVLALIGVTILAAVAGFNLGEGKISLVLMAAFFVVGVMFFTIGHPLIPVLLITFCGFSSRGDLFHGIGYWDMIALAFIARWAMAVPFQKKVIYPLKGWFTFLCIVGCTGILFLHYGLNKFGNGTGSEGGARLALLAIILIVSAYLIQGQVIQLEHVWLVPVFGIIPGMIQMGFELINFFMPSMVPYTYLLYKDQNFEAVRSFLMSAAETQRLAGFREIGLGLALLSASYIPSIRKIISPAFGVSIAGMMLGTVAILAAGYRSFVIRMFVLACAAFYTRSRLYLLILPICMILGIQTLAVVNSHIVPLPFPVQRALSWVPGGNWSWEARFDANDSLEWRYKVWGYFWSNIFPKHKWIGQGLRYYSSENLERLQHESGEMQAEYEVEVYALTQALHSGFLSSLDFVGIIGTTFLIMLTCRGFYLCWSLMNSPRRLRPWQMWIILYYLSFHSMFWITGFFERGIIIVTILPAFLEHIHWDLKNNPGQYPLKDTSV